jgi:hypothetical protein
VAAVVGVEHLPELGELAEQAQRRARDFEDARARAVGDGDGGVARDAGEDRHLAEAAAGRNLADLARGIRLAVADVNVEEAVDGDVEGVAAPVALPHDLLAGPVLVEADVGADLLAVVVAAVGDDFEVEFVREVAVVAFEQLGDDVDLPDGVEDGLVLLNLCGHRPGAESGVCRCQPKGKRVRELNRFRQVKARKKTSGQ